VNPRPVQVALTPDTAQVADLLRVLARHLVNAATELDTLAAAPPQENQDSDRP
jgi:hypothetical protein